MELGPRLKNHLLVGHIGLVLDVQLLGVLVLAAVLFGGHLVLLSHVEADGEVIVVDTLRADLAVVLHPAAGVGTQLSAEACDRDACSIGKSL